MKTKTTGRRLFATLLTLTLLLSAVPMTGITATAAESGDFGYALDFQYEILSETDKTCVINGYTGTAAEIEIPSALDGYTVTKVSFNEVLANETLTRITIPSTVTEIEAFDNGEAPFLNYTALTAINVSSDNPNYSSVDGVLFNKDQTELLKYPQGKTDTSYVIPSSVEKIGPGAFGYNYSLVRVTISNSVTEIGTGAFHFCSVLESADLPSSATTLGNGIFGDCYALKSAVIPDGVTSIGNNMFCYCQSLTSVSIPDSVTSIGLYAFYECNALESITIPDNVTSIGDCAFSYCHALTSITIPDSVRSIGGMLVYGCNMLKRVHLGKGVTSIGRLSFSDCPQLTVINVDSANPNYCSENGVLFNKDKTEIVAYPNGKTDTTYTIPDGVTSIGDGAFSYCTSLTSAVIPSSVTHIDVLAFYGCENLTIYGFAGSYAEIYADENGIPFIALVSAEDTTSGIIVMETSDDVLPEGTELNVEQTESTETRVSYNITLVQNGAEIQPAGTVTVKIPVPETMDGDTCKVYHREADGTYTDMNAVFRDGYMVFITDHFSEYVVTAEALLTTDLGDVNGDGTVDAVDARWVLQAAAGMRTLENIAAADVNGDSTIDAVDARWILQAAAGMRTL